MLKILVNGCNGKMGQEVVKQVENTENAIVLLGVDRIDSGDNNFPVYTNIQEIVEKPDVIIDFSVPDATFKILEYAIKENIPTVIATTGFSDEQLSKIEEYSKIIPIFKSANMSFEINLMAKIVSETANLLKDSDIEIVETHHNKKIDSPSGTALLLADRINSALSNKLNYEYNRHEKREKRSKSEIGIHSIRGGTEVGKHTVLFLGDNETFEITHSVTSRSVFAKGAIKAAIFLANKQPGLYDMNHLIG